MNIWSGAPTKKHRRLQPGRTRNPRQYTLEEIALLPPIPGQLLFILITPPNSINNLAIPVLDLAHTSMPGLELQPCDPTMHPSRQAHSEVFLAVLLVRQFEEVDILYL